MYKEPEKKPTLKVPTEERLLNLTVYLMSGRRARMLREIVGSVTGYEPGKEYESNRRMFIRDKKALAELGIPVRLTQTEDPLTGLDVEAYKIDPTDVYLPAIPFTEREAAALLELEGSLSAGGRPPLRELGWALEKVASATGRRAAAGAASGVLLRLDRQGTESSGLVGALQDAVAERRTVRVSYRSPVTGKTVARSVDPYGLFLRSGYWFLHGWCHLRKEERTFRVARLELIEQPAEKDTPDFELPDGFSLADRIRRRAPWEFGDEPPTRVVVCFHPDAFWQVRNIWGDLPSVEFDENARTITVNSVNNDALVSWALEFADRAEIVSPAPLRKKIAAALRSIAENA